MSNSKHLLCALLVSTAAWAQSPPSLVVHELPAGPSTSAPAELAFRSGHAYRFEFAGPAGQHGLLAVSFTPPPQPAILIGGSALALDPASFFALIPAQPFAAATPLDKLVLAPVLPAGSSIWMQGAAIDAASASVALSAGLVLHAEGEAFTTIEKGTKSAHPDAGGLPIQYVIGNQGSWQIFWSLHRPGTPAPSIDFAQQRVLVAFHGLAPTTGFSLSVQQLHATAAGLTPDLLYLAPLGCGSFFAETRPYHFVAFAAASSGPLLGTLDTHGDSCP